MMRQRYDVVLMDFFGTIADGDGRQVESTCGRIVRDHQLDMAAETLAVLWGRQFFEVLEACNQENFRNLYDCECISLTRTMRALNVECDPIPYAEELQQYWQSPPLHAEAKQALRELPVPVCCVSNADEQDLQAAIRMHGLRFDEVVSSERARSYKPHREIFQYALGLMNATPERSMHVGDSLHSDVNGAQALGIATVWVERDGRISDIGECAPDHTIKSLNDLSTFFV